MLAKKEKIVFHKTSGDHFAAAGLKCGQKETPQQSKDEKTTTVNTEITSTMKYGNDNLTST